MTRKSQGDERGEGGVGGKWICRLKGHREGGELEQGGWCSGAGDVVTEKVRSPCGVPSVRMYSREDRATKGTFWTGNLTVLHTSP